MLLADDDLQTRVSLSKPVQRSLIGEGWADEHDVIESGTEWAAELFHKKLRLPRVRRVTMRGFCLDPFQYCTDSNCFSCMLNWELEMMKT